ncbi:MAG: hypothetical protein JNM49_07955 [Flavobacteriales bacterium]|nr:hypothetical protein [Flavobacteriales bacterium]
MLLRQRAWFLALAFGTATHMASQTVVDSILHDGLFRTYRLYAPPGFSPAESPALVFNLHGLGSDAEQQEAYSRMNFIAEDERFLICYLNGVNNSWNLGLGQVDDIGTISALIDRFVLTHGVDEQRVYACGMSQGGYFSFVLGCQLADRVAAIATVSSSMAQGLSAACDPPRPVPVFMINGTADPIVPYTGGIQNIAVDDAITHWVTHNACSTPSAITPFPDNVPTDGCTATRADFSGCDSGTEVDLIAVIGGGHTWPGATIPIGVTCQDFDASHEIWLFFERFTLSGAAGIGQAEESHATIGPVPADGILTLRTCHGRATRLTLIDPLGRNCYTQRVSGGAVVDVSRFAPGRYTAELECNGVVARHPVIIAR